MCREWNYNSLNTTLWGSGVIHTHDTADGLADCSSFKPYNAQRDCYALFLRAAKLY